MYQNRVMTTSFDFAAHAKKLADGLPPSAAASGYGDCLDAPELLPLIHAWLESPDPNIRWLAETSRVLPRSDRAYEYFSAKFAAEPGRPAWAARLLDASDRGFEAIRGDMMADVHGSEADLGMFAGSDVSLVFAATARTEPEIFTRRAALWLDEADRAFAAHRRDDRRGRSPAEVAGLFAALTLAPSLSDAVMARLAKLAGPRDLVARAFFALYRHGHPHTVARLQRASDVLALIAAEDRVVAGDQSLVYFMTSARGPAMLQELLLQPATPLRWTGVVSLAQTLGVWDPATQDAYFAALERRDGDAEHAAHELPLLGDEALRRLERLASRFTSEAAFARAVGLQRSGSKKVRKDDRARLWRLGVDELVARLTALTPADLRGLPDLIREARRAGERLEQARDALRGSRNPVTQLVLLLGARPAPVLHRDSLAYGAHAYSWASAVRHWEQRWHPGRADPQVGACEAR